MIDFVMSAHAAVKTAGKTVISAVLSSPAAHATTAKRWVLFGMLALMGTAAQADITPSKTFIPSSWNGTGAAPAPLSAPLNQGDEAWLEITVINSSGNVVTALAATDPLPSGVVLASIPSPFAASACGASSAANFTAIPGAGSFSFSALQVPAAAGSVVGRCDVYVKVKVYGSLGTGAGSISTMNNQIPVGNVTGLDGATPVTNSSAAAQSIQAIKLANPSVSKGFSPGTVPMGGSSTATIYITNNAAAAVDLTTLTENLPATLTATSTPTVQCAGTGTPSAATNMGGSFPNLTFPATTTLAASSTCTVSFTVRALAQSGNGYTANNSIPANGLGNSRLLNSPAASANLSVQSPLLTTKSFSPSTAAANQLVTMTITLQNRSAFAISAGSLSDTFAGATAGGGVMTVKAPGGASGGGGSCAAASAFTAISGAGSISASGLTIAANSSCSYTVPVTVDNDGVYNNVTSVTTYTSADSNVGTQTNSTASATLTAYDQITATKAGQDPRNPNDSASVVAPGNRIIYRVAVANYTSSVLADVQVTDPLPFESVSGAQVVYLPTSGTTPTSVTGSGCTGPTSVGGTTAAPIFSGINVPAGSGANPGSCVLEFWVQIPTNWPVGTNIVNSIPANNISYAGGTKFLQGSAVVDTRPTVNRLTIGKSVLPNAVFQGDTAVVTVTLNNNSYYAMTASQFDDAALFGASNSVRMASPANPSTTCTGTPVYTYSAGGSSFAASGLTVPARGNCVVTWRVVGINPGGPYTNTLPGASVSGTVDSGAGPVTFNAVGNATANITVNSVLDVSKTFSPTVVGGAGGVSRVTITLQNVGNAALTRVAAVDNLLPSGLTVNNPANATTSCGGTSVVSPLPGATSVNLTGGTLFANSSCLVQFDVISSTNTASINTINPGDVTADNGVFNASAATATLNKLVSPGVNISKAFNPTTLPSVGAVSRLSVNVQNNALGAVLLTNAGFVDNMPAGMVLSATPNPVSNCSGASLTAVAGASSFAMANATLAAGSTCLVAVNVTLVSSGTFQNTLPVGVLTNDQNVSNADPFSTSLATLATLGVEKSFSPVAALPNTPVRLKIRVINSLTLSFTNLAVTDNLPSGMTVSSPSALSTTCTGAAVSSTSTSISLSGASLPAASGGVPATCEITVLVQSASFGAYTNNIPAGGVTGLSSLGTTVTNLDPASAVFRGLQPLSLTKAFANANRIPGQSDTLTITITNPNATPINNVSLVDNLPTNAYLANPPVQSTSCTGSTITENGSPLNVPVNVGANAGGTSLRISGAQIPANGSCTFQADVLSNQIGTFVNRIPDGAITSFEGVTNPAPATAQFTTFDPPVLGKQFIPLQIGSGGTAKLRIVLGNTNSSALTLTANLVDNLPTAPGAMTLAATPIDITATTCTLGSINAPAGGNTVTYNSGATIASGGCVIVVNVTATVDGTYNNVIPGGGLATNGGSNPVPATAALSVSSTLASISGRVYRDSNNDGIPNGVEAGIDAQVIELLDSTGTTVVATTTTDSLGNYAFLGLTPGTYRVREPAQPAGTLNGITSVGTVAGTATGTATAVGTTPSLISAVTVLGGQSSIDNNFGELVPSRLKGKVFLDPNNNGTQQGGETGIAGVVMTLSGSNDLGPIPAGVTATTLADGSYAFTGLRPGSYTITEGAQPSGTANGITTASAVYGIGSSTAAVGGVSGTATAPTVLTVAAPVGTSRIGDNGGTSVPITLPSNSESLNNDFAEIPTSRSISGRIFTDVNNDGLSGTGDTPIGGQLLTLTGLDASGSPVNRTVNANPDGTYTFANLPESNGAGYTVSYATAGSPTGNTLGQSVVGSTGGTGATSGANRTVLTGIPLTGLLTSSGNNNFTQRPPGVISGRVYLDANNNGLVELSPGGNDAPLNGVQLVLTGIDYGFDGVLGGGDDITLPAVGAAGAVTTNTAADGTYSFGGLRVGNYSVTEPTQPANSTNGITTAGTVTSFPAGGTPGVATPVTTSPSAINTIALPAGGVSPNNNFGELPTSSSLSGRIFTDINNDGVAGTGDTGISGLLLTLTGTDANGTPVSRTTTANSDGTYSFANLPESNGAGYTVSYATTGSPAHNTLGQSVPGTTGGTGASTGANRVVLNGIPLIGYLTTSVNNNFTQRPPGVISGRVYLDANNNGLYEAAPGGNDAPLNNVQLVLTGIDYGFDGVLGGGDDTVLPSVGAVGVITTNTAPDGTYSFGGLRAGSYSVTEPTQPANSSNGITTAGTVTSFPAGGTPGVATGLTTAPSAISNIALPAGGVSPNNNFGEIPTSSAITGVVWKDTNNDGLQNNGELGIGGVRIELTGTDLAGQTVTRFTDTNLDGSYSFTGLPPGTYTVTEPTQPTATLNGTTVKGNTTGTATPVATVPSAISGITIGIAQTSSNNNFGEIVAASVSGRVYNDNNNNGTVDTGETGIPGVPVFLDGVNDLGSVIHIELNTLADGSYSFPTLRPGTYKVTEPTQPANTVNGITSAGTVNGVALGTATAVSDPVSEISALVLGSGAQSINNNFGEIGDSSDMLVSKSHSPAKFTVNNVGTYTFTVRNAGQRNSSGVYTVSDRLPPGLTLASTPVGAGWTCTGAAGASSFSCTSSTVVNAGATATQTFEAKIAVGAAAAAASPVQNVVMVDGGGEYEARRPTAAERDAFNSNPLALPICDPAVLNNACRDPTPVQLAASLSGTVWYDIGTTLKVLDGADRRLPNWKVELVNPATGAVVATTTTGADGSYKLVDLIPGVPLAVRFRDPSSNVVFGYPVNGETAPGSSGASCDATAALANGTQSSCVQKSPSTELGIVLAPGQNLAQQSLPVDPSGVVYDSTTRQPVPGSVVTLAPTGVCTGYDPATSLVNIAAGGYTVIGNSTSMTVGADGFYQFLFAPAAPPSCAFTLSVTPPAGYTFASTAILAETTTLTAPGGVGSTFAVQPQAAAPVGAPGPATTYYLALNSGSAGANIIHNHLPIDPAVPTALALTKSGDKAQAEVGDSVLYTVTVRQVSGPALNQVTVYDRLPAGFTLIRGTVRVNGVSVADPVSYPAGGLGPNLGFNLGPIAKNAQIALTYRVRVGVGSQQGEGVNRAKAYGCGTPAGCLTPTFTPIAGAVPSNEGQHRVKVTGGVFTAQACVVGKIFVDCNNNHVQDPEELGIPGVRLYMEDGSYVVSDSEGKYSQCDISPKSHVLKVDSLTLPRGSRLTTSSNRNLGDAGSLFIDLKNGELHRADFVEGSCSNTVLEQVKARRSQGEIRSVETEKKKGPALKFESKPRGAPQEATDSANQPIVKPRTPSPGGGIEIPRSESERNIPVWQLPLNAPSSAVQGGSNAR